jgi:hypothetical protein
LRPSGTKNSFALFCAKCDGYGRSPLISLPPRWHQAEGETPEQLAGLKKHFATPRDAVAFILDQFPIVRKKDEKAQGHYHTQGPHPRNLRRHAGSPTKWQSLYNKPESAAGKGRAS